MANWMDVPNECECGNKEFQYIVTKVVTIAIDEYDEEPQPIFDGASEGFTDITCTNCAKVWVCQEDVTEDADIDAMLEL